MIYLVTYNPWSKKYKEPFGAVKINSYVVLKVDCEPNQKIKLLIHRDSCKFHCIEMPKNKQGQAEVELNFNKGAGLYFYYFSITEKTSWGEATSYYGASKNGGLGESYSLENEVLPYQITVFSSEDPAPNWFKNGIAYQIFPDRFYNGTENGKVLFPKANSFLYGQMSDDPFYIKDEKGEIVRWDFYGGNLLGIIAKIPYLKALGINIIYLNPIFEAHSNHRYDTSDFFKIDSVLGTEKDFKKLLRHLHQNGIKLILDGVFSHVGKNSKYFNLSGEYGEAIGAAQSIESPYYPWFKFIDYPNVYKSWWNISDLPEIDKTNESYQEFIESVLDKWLSLGVDGFRLDVADELPDEFIRRIRKKLNQFPEKVLIGEVWEDASNKISYDKRRNYILGNSLHGVMNYPFRELIIKFLSHEINAKDFANQLMVLKENYPPDAFQACLNNIGTHDTERILTVVSNSKIAFAIGLLFILPGVPTIYYGDELGLTGKKDPENRKFMPWHQMSQRSSLPYQYYQEWIKIRTNNNAIQNGDLLVFYQADCLGIVRKDNYQTVIYVLNTESKYIMLETQQINWLGDISNELNQKLNGVVIPKNDEKIIILNNQRHTEI